ncbi:MAG: hypothetical protein QNL04_08420 [SAR324 cluster bacterium]|nr:hypothetical protein [SAR324 cluster bacterium]
MKQKLTLILLMVTLSFWLFGCEKPTSDGVTYAQVSIGLNTPVSEAALNYRRLYNSTLPTDAATVLIVAVPAGTTFTNDYTKIENAIDVQLLDIPRSQVSLKLPLSTPVQLFEYTFSSAFSLNKLQARAPVPIASAEFDSFIVDGTGNITLKSFLKLVTLPRSLTITSTASQVTKGSKVAVTALGAFADGTTQDITQLIDWSGSDDSILTIDNRPGTRAIVTGVALGSATVTATAGNATTSFIMLVNEGTGNITDDFIEMLSGSNFEIDARNDYGGMMYSLSEVTWEPFTESNFELDPFTRDWIPSPNSNKKGDLSLTAGIWAESAFSIEVGSIDYDNTKIQLSVPLNATLKLYASEVLTGKTVNLSGDPNMRIEVPFADPTSKAFHLEYVRLIGQNEFSLWEPEFDDTNMTSYPDLDTFLMNKFTNSEPISCTEGQQTRQCIFIETFAAAQTTGNLTEVTLDYNYNAISTAVVAGTWEVMNNLGPDILIARPNQNIYNYEMGGNPIWSLYMGEVWRGGELSGAERQTFTQYNETAKNEITQFLQTAPINKVFPTMGGTDTNTGGPGTSTPLGLAFSGVATYPVLSNTTAVDFGIANSWTFGMYVNPQLNSLTQTLFDLSLGTDFNRITAQITALGEFEFLAYDNAGVLSMDYVSIPTLATGGLYHLAVTYDGTSVKLYINGAEVATSANTNIAVSLGLIARNLYIGLDYLGANPYVGEMNSLAMWNRALTPYELRDIVNHPAGLGHDLNYTYNNYSPSGLVHYYRFVWDPANLGNDYVASGWIFLDSPINISGTDIVTMTGLFPENYRSRAIVYPRGGENLPFGGNLNVTWEMGMFASDVDIYIISNTAGGLNPLDPGVALNINAATLNSLATGVQNSGNYIANIGSYTSASDYRVIVVDYMGNWSMSETNFSINMPMTIAVPTSAITIDGLATDWGASMASPSVADPQFDDNASYVGDDLSGLSYLNDGTSLFIKIDSYDGFPTTMQNGPTGSEGRIEFEIFSDTGVHHFGVAYDSVNSWWAIGANGSGSFGTFVGNSYLAVSTATTEMEINVPLAEMGNPTEFYGIHVRVVNCCSNGIFDMDEIIAP